MLGSLSSYNIFLSVVWIIDFESFLGRISDVTRLEQGSELDTAVGTLPLALRIHVCSNQLVSEVFCVCSTVLV